jgi:phosphoribosylformylglycinamidine synthase
MLGVIDDMDHVTRAGFLREGDEVALLGFDRFELGGSELLVQMTGSVVGQAPHLDITEESKLQTALLEEIRAGRIHSAHDCSEGGLAVTLAECAITSEGGDLGVHAEYRHDDEIAALFGESQSRVIISFDPVHRQAIAATASRHGVPLVALGNVVRDMIRVNGIELSVAEAAGIYNGAIERVMTTK